MEAELGLQRRHVETAWEGEAGRQAEGTASAAAQRWAGEEARGRKGAQSSVAQSGAQ